MEAFSESSGVLFFFILPSSFVSCVNTHALTFMVKNTKSLLFSFFLFKTVTNCGE